MNRIFFILLFLFIYPRIFGDDTRYSFSFLSENMKYQLYTDEPFFGKWILHEIIDNNIIYDYQYQYSEGKYKLLKDYISLTPPNEVKWHIISLIIFIIIFIFTIYINKILSMNKKKVLSKKIIYLIMFFSIFSFISINYFIINTKSQIIENDNILYEFNYNLSDKTVIISNDGRNIIAIDDYSPGFPDDDEPKLIFFKDGILIKEYLLVDLLDNIYNISKSASHFKWAFRNSFIIEDNYFNIITYELYEYSIEINTGEIVEKKRNSLLTEDALYVYGEVTKNNNDTYNFEIKHLVYGKPENDIIIFKSDLKINFRNKEYMTLIIKDNIAVYRNDVLFNLVTYKGYWWLDRK
jgi:hypothetical protein